MLLVQSYRCQCGHEWAVTDAQLVISTCSMCESYPIYAFHEAPLQPDDRPSDPLESRFHIALDHHDYGEPQ